MISNPNPVMLQLGAWLRTTPEKQPLSLSGLLGLE